MKKYFVEVKGYGPLEITKEQFMAAEAHHGFRSKFPGSPATGGFSAGPVVIYSVRQQTSEEVLQQPSQVAAKAIKTYQAWEDGPEMPISEFMKPGDEVDEDMLNHFGGVVSPQYCTRRFTQVGEAAYEENGRYHYMSFGTFDGRHIYLGVLPPFKQPKY